MLDDVIRGDSGSRYGAGEYKGASMADQSGPITFLAVADVEIVDENPERHFDNVRSLFHDAIFAKAAAYAKEKNLPPRDLTD